jgi:alanyl-tRNA synthetase
MTERLYLNNPYLREINAKVVKKEYSNGKFYITLNRTIFYPHLSGGQPRDKGSIGGVEVIDVYEDGNDIIHIVEDNITSNTVNLNIDWDTRFDHMQQHTGQHLLSAVFAKLYNAKTVGFHLGSEYVYIDVTIPSLTDNDLEKIERFANEVIYSNFSIKTYIVDKTQASQLPLRKQPKVESNIRIVEIDNIDFSPCAGTHHRRIGEVGILKIRKWEKYKGNIRVEFVCGNRALKDYTWKNTIINNISTLLSAKDISTFNSVEKLYNDYKNLEKENKEIKEELFNYKSKELINDSMFFNGVKLIKKTFSNSDLKEVKFLTSKILSCDDIVCVFGVIEQDKCQIILGRSENIQVDMREILNASISYIDGRGGGSQQLVQGGGTNISGLNSCMENCLSLIKEAI